MMGQGAQAAPASGGEPHPWWWRWLARGLGVVGGGVAMLFGVWVCFTLSAKCFVIGVFQICLGFLVIALEAPFLCVWFDFIEKIQRFSESRSNWHKAFLYGILGIIPIIICFELATVMGGGLIAASGVCYGVLAIGKKADRSTMLASAGSGGGRPNDAWDTNLVDQGKNMPPGP